MRRVATYPALLGVLLALFMAPYQHVHQTEGHAHKAGKWGNFAIVHVHFGGLSLLVGAAGEGKPVASHERHAAWSLNLFAVASHTHPAPCIPAKCEAALLVGVPKAFSGVKIVEAPGHDPPVISLSVPRSPPV